MNMFSKVMSLGLLVSLLVAVPVSARCNDDRKRDCHEKKCDVVGAFTAQMVQESLADVAVFEFHADGTMIISDIFGSLSPATHDQSIYTGTWKRSGHHCFSYCASNVVLIQIGVNPTAYRSKVTGTICFDNKCQKATGKENFIVTYYAIDDLGLTTPLTDPAPVDLGALNLQRLKCCK